MTFDCSGRYPFDDNLMITQIQTAQYSFDGALWSKISQEAKDMISKLIVVDPNQRLTASACLRHPWFAQTEGEYHLLGATRTNK